jgi:hypothetical protein
MVEFEKVKPGDLITADLINTIMGKLKMVDIEGMVEVPKLFGISLSQAKAILINPSVGLVPGIVLAADGERIYPENTDALEMPVLNQFPAPGEIVLAGSVVDMVIAAKVSSVEPSPQAKHIVTDMYPPDSARANQRIKVIGENFEEPYYRNSVIFDDVYNTTPLDGSSTTELIVDVPKSIPNLPRDVKVAVQAYGITKYLPRLYKITPESAEPELKITGVEPDPAATFVRVGGTLWIKGTGFSDTANLNKITFISRNPDHPTHTINGETVEQLTGDEKRVSVTVPEFPPEMSPGDGAVYDITLHIGDNVNNIATGGSIEIRPPLG